MQQKELQTLIQKLYAIYMKFLADENLGVKIPRYLQSIGIDIISVKDSLSGISDKSVLKLANKQKRILITLDKDFGELVYKEGLIHSGVIYLRLKNQSYENKKAILEKLFKSKRNFEGKFTKIKG